MNPPTEASSAEVGRAVDHLFRRESGRLVAILTKRFGPINLHLVEDVVQDALVKAMQTWPLTGVPENPTAWLLQTARNRAIDHLRRDSRWSGRKSELEALAEHAENVTATETTLRFEDEISDSQLRMMFVCCDPSLPPEAHVALILKTLCGFGEREIAASFFISEAAVAKRLVRARERLRDRGVSFELPGDSSLASRTDSVLQALYLLFNEGYKASHGDALLRADLCAEAIRLTELLVTHPAGERSDTHALLALMLLNFARLPARTDYDGGLLALAEQNRSLWDRSAIAQGMRHLELSAAGQRLSRYHIEAGIAASHALAPDFAATNWRQIIALYDQLMELDGSPIVALNRAVAVAQVEGPGAALTLVENMSDCAALERYYLSHAVMGHLRASLGDKGQAAKHFRRALDLAAVSQERDFLRSRLEQCGSTSSESLPG